MSTSQDTFDEMTVRIIDRRAGFKYVDVTIGTLCPRCGGPRGTPVRCNLFSSDDDAWHNVDAWHNPCGHTDMYLAVLAEADRLTAAKAMLV